MESTGPNSPLIQRSGLAPKTRPVFELLSGRSDLKEFCLVGGTAIALQLKHRLSEDLDFWQPQGQLKPSSIDRLMRELLAEGHRCSFATQPDQTSQFRINTGMDLRFFIQDWAVDNVKVQFFAPEDIAYRHFAQFECLTPEQTNFSFSVMGLEGLFAMKSYTIHRRTRSRDLVDLWCFFKNGKTVADILEAAGKASPSTSPDYAKAVLRGDVPLDAEDEGFEALEINCSLEQIYSDFSKGVDEYEIELARLSASGLK